MKRLALMLSFSSILAVSVLISPSPKVSHSTFAVQQAQDGCRLICDTTGCAFVCD